MSTVPVRKEPSSRDPSSPGVRAHGTGEGYLRGRGDPPVLDRLRVEIREGLVVALGRNGHPLPNDLLDGIGDDMAAAAGLIVEGPGGARLDPGRVAAVLEAQARGPLGPGGRKAVPWLLAMLGIGPHLEEVDLQSLEAEGRRPTLAVSGSEILIRSAGRDEFRIASRIANPTLPRVRIQTLASGAEIPIGSVIAALRADGGITGNGRGHALPTCSLACDGASLLLRTGQGSTFRLSDGDVEAAEPVQVVRPNGLGATIVELIDALEIAPAVDGADVAED